MVYLYKWLLLDETTILASRDYPYLAIVDVWCFAVHHCNWWFTIAIVNHHVHPALASNTDPPWPFYQHPSLCMTNIHWSLITFDHHCFFVSTIGHRDRSMQWWQKISSFLTLRRCWMAPGSFLWSESFWSNFPWGNRDNFAAQIHYSRDRIETSKGWWWASEWSIIPSAPNAFWDDLSLLIFWVQMHSQKILGAPGSGKLFQCLAKKTTS